MHERRLFAVATVLYYQREPLNRIYSCSFLAISLATAITTAGSSDCLSIGRSCSFKRLFRRACAAATVQDSHGRFSEPFGPKGVLAALALVLWNSTCIKGRPSKVLKLVVHSKIRPCYQVG